MGSFAAVFPFELVIALPYCPAVLIRGMPHLGSVESTAVPADNGSGEYTVGDVPLAQFLPSGNLGLHQIPFVWIDDK